MARSGADRRERMTRPRFQLEYKLDTGMRKVGLHHHDFYELYFLLAGDVHYTVESRVYHVLPGDVFLVSPRELHKLRIRTERDVYERYVLWLEPRYLARLSSGRTDLARCRDSGREGYRNRLRLSPEEQQAVRSLMDRLHRETEGDGYGADLMGESLLTGLLVTVNRLAAREGAGPEELPRSSALVSQVVDHIGLHYAEPLTLDALAERFFVSKYYLSHEFNRITGESVHRYILKKRLLIARQLLARGERPGQVWERCGFGDYTGFYRAFRAEYGSSPRDFAQAARREE